MCGRLHFASNFVHNTNFASSEMHTVSHTIFSQPIDCYIKNSPPSSTCSFLIPELPSIMYLYLASLSCLLNTLTFTTSAPLSVRTRDMISARAPQYSDHVQTQHDTAIIDSLGFHFAESAQRNATCTASDVECVTGQKAQPTSPRQSPPPPSPSPEPNEHVAIQKRSDESIKRDAQASLVNSGTPNVGKPHSFPQPFSTTGSDNHNPAAPAAANFGNEINDWSNSGSQNMSCAASDVSCVAKRTSQGILPANERA